MERFYLNTEIVLTDSDEAAPELGRLYGYATKYNTPSHNRGGYRDIFRPGVFGDNLQEADGFDVKALFNHDHEQYLARTSNGSLQLASDDVGLKFSIDLPNTTLGRDTAELVKRGDIAGMSFGYLPSEYEWLDEEEFDLPLREHTAGTLIEVSVVFQPAIPQTEVEMASLGDPTETTLKSLKAWKAQRAGTPRIQAAKRWLRIFEATA